MDSTLSLFYCMIHSSSKLVGVLYGYTVCNLHPYSKSLGAPLASTHSVAFVYYMLYGGNLGRQYFTNATVADYSVV
jgi:hypothetical protein